MKLCRSCNVSSSGLKTQALCFLCEANKCACECNRNKNVLLMIKISLKTHLSDQSLLLMTAYNKHMEWHLVRRLGSFLQGKVTLNVNSWVSSTICLPMHFWYDICVFWNIGLFFYFCRSPKYVESLLAGFPLDLFLFLSLQATVTFQIFQRNRYLRIKVLWLKGCSLYYY